MKGNEGPKDQKERKQSFKRQILEKETLQNLQGEMAILGEILARSPFWKDQKAKMKGNEATKG